MTGANGHLGRRLVERLCAEGREVRTLVRSERAAKTLRALPCAASFEVRIGDPTDAAAVAQAAAGCAVIVHLVGILKETRDARYEDAHERTAEAVADAAARAGARRIVTLSIVGSRPDHENACLASKGRAEEILLGGQVPAVVLQVPMVLGPGEIAAGALRAKAAAPIVALPRGGASLEQPIDSSDVVSAIVAAAQAPGIGKRTLQLAGPESLPHRELVERAAALRGRRPWIVPIPLFALRALAALCERFLANPPLTRAMLGVLDHDDHIDPAPACTQLGITLTPLAETLRRSVGPGSETP